MKRFPPSQDSNLLIEAAHEHSSEYEIPWIWELKCSLCLKESCHDRTFNMALKIYRTECWMKQTNAFVCAHSCVNDCGICTKHWIWCLVRVDKTVSWREAAKSWIQISRWRSTKHIALCIPECAMKECCCSRECMVSSREDMNTPMSQNRNGVGILKIIPRPWKFRPFDQRFWVKQPPLCPESTAYFGLGKRRLVDPDG